MTGIAFRLEITDHLLRAELARVRGVVTNFEPLLHDVGAEVESSTLLRFETGLAPDGTPWAQSLRVKLHGGKTLLDKGDFRDSYHYVVEGPAAVEVGSNAVQAAITQTGGTISAKGEALAFTLASGDFVMAKSVNVPKREVLGLSDRDERALIDIAATHLLGAAA